jgi:cytochrome b561
MSFSIPVRALTISARLVPQLAGFALLLLSVINLGLGIKNLKKTPPAPNAETGTDKAASSYKKVALTLVFIALYAAGLSVFGFLISSFLFLCAQIFLLSPKEKRKPLIVGMSALVCTAAIYVLFQMVFHVNLPAGILT